MLLYAIKMLMGDRAKYIGIIIGLSFASFIIVQQASIFAGLMSRTYGLITDTRQPNIWVVDKQLQEINDAKPLKTTQIYRVRSIDGVKWAVPFYKGVIKAKLKNGNYQSCVFLGIDDATLIGGPPRMIEGSLTDLRTPDAVIVNDVGASKQLSIDDTPLQVGDQLELNDNRAVVVGKCRVTRTFQTQPVIYTTFNRAITFAPQERKVLSFVLAHSEDGLDPKDVCRRIEQVTGLAAYTQDEFIKLTIDYYMKKTGIPLNFGVAVLLGFIIGTVISGQTFYNFTLDNLRYLGTFKAMGVTNATLTKMTLLQAIIVGGIGWGIGIGAASLFGFYTLNTELSFLLPWQLFLLSGATMFFICMFAALISLWKVFKLDPAIVFRS